MLAYIFFNSFILKNLGIIWTMLLVGNDSRVQATIAAELGQVFAGEEDDCEITTEHCRQMKYLEMAIKEALRIFPSGKY